MTPVYYTLSSLPISPLVTFHTSLFMSLPHNETDLSRIYAQRFAANLDYRKRVWRVLIDSFFQQ